MRIRVQTWQDHLTGAALAGLVLAAPADAADLSRAPPPFGQSVPRLVGWSTSPSMCVIFAGSPFVRSPFEYMMMPQATEQ
jgi:hypothetical protein